MKKLIIIEGAGKISKIKSYLGSEYDVYATGGHFRQLKSDGLYNTGISSTYEPTFEFSSLGQKNWKNIKSALTNNNYSQIYIASDPDREGEGIAWHIYQSLPSKDKAKAKRITYNEISKNAILNAINNPKEIDLNLVHGQFARQAYDKIFGFRGSRFVQQNLNLKSIGRVQGVAVKFLGDRAAEIANYKPHFKNEVSATILDEKEDVANLIHIDKDGNRKRYEKDETIPNIENPFICQDIQVSDNKYEKPPAPYITSTLLTDAVRILNVKVKTVQETLQKLYEKGFISYPRTDSKTISDTFFKELMSYLKNSPHKEYVRDIKGTFKNSASSQEGHECLRIIHPEILPNSNQIKDLGQNAVAVYNLLYTRTMIQGLKDAIYQDTDYFFDASSEKFTIKSKKYLELNWRNYPSCSVNEKVYDFKINKKYQGKVETKEVNVVAKPSPYNEASLIKELEKRGIGRPSTYATFPNILQDRGYASLQGKEFVLSQEGKLLYEIIQNNFQDFINYEFTKEFEEDLDKIATGKLDYQKYLKDKDKEIDNLVNSKVESKRIEKEIKLSDKFCNECQEYRREKVASNGNKYYVCANFKYDAKTKQSSGCSIEWENKPKVFNKKSTYKKGR